MNMFTRAAGAAAALCLIASPAYAAGFMKIPDIPGESQRADHEDEIDFSTVTWSVASDASAQVGAGRARARSQVGPVIVEKAVDSSSPYLFQAAATGKSFKEVTLAVRKDSGEAHLDYLTITLTNVKIASVESMAGDASTEQVTLNYEKINIKYVEQADDHSAGDEHEIEYDVARGA
ncbi:MAG: type VI secretion system tube protein Hcp [Henriciella sp.]